MRIFPFSKICAEQNPYPEHPRQRLVVAGSFLLALTVAGCGFVLSAIPRFSDIKTVVTPHEVSGHWSLRTNNLPVTKLDGYVPKPGEEIFITLRTNLTYSCRMVERVFETNGEARIWQEEGTWSLYYNPRDFEGKNKLQLESSKGAVSRLRIALDDGRMVLWRSWGDPDEGIDLVFERPVVATNALNGQELREAE